MEENITPVNLVLRHQKGLSIVTWLSAILAFLIAGLVAAVIFYEGRKAYWDAQVKEMCENDGGIRVYERVAISRADYERLGGRNGMIPIPHEKNAAKDYPFVSSGTGQIINESNPRVYRTESNYLRRSDRKLIATSVQYSRVGGDFPLRFAHHSTYACPDAKTAAAEEKSIFSIEGLSK